MARIDAVDEAVIDSSPASVFRAVLDEAAGLTHWWAPYWESKPRGEPPFDREGAVFDVTIPGKHVAKFSSRITKIVEGRLVEVEYFEGDFVGTGTWTFEPQDGKTKVRFRWNVKPKRLMFVLVSPFIDMGKTHSDVMQKGFKGLNGFLSQK